MWMMHNGKSGGQIKAVKKEEWRTLMGIIVLGLSGVLEPSKLLYISVSPPEKQEKPP